MSSLHHTDVEMGGTSVFKRNDVINIPRSTSRGSLILDDVADETIPLTTTSEADFDLNNYIEASSQHYKILSGVIVPYLQASMLGSTLLLRLPWITGQSGMVLALVICILCSFSVILTSLSLAAIGTDGKIERSCNLYNLLRKNLGRELASSICLSFFLGKVLTAAMYCLGAAEAICWNNWGNTYLPSYLHSWQHQIIAGLICFTLTFTSGVGSNVVITVLGYFALIVAAVTILSVIVGVVVHKPKEIQSGRIFPAFSPGINFYILIGIFYPAFVGAMANTVQPSNLPRRRLPSPIGNIGGVCVILILSVLIILLFGLYVPLDKLRGEKLIAGKNMRIFCHTLL